LSWAGATGQRWKLHVFIALILLTFALLFGLFRSIGGGPDDPTVLFAVGMGVTAAVAHFWIALAIRCPSCQRRVGWFVMMTRGKDWLAQLWRGESCPACGDSGLRQPSGAAQDH
jgi:hypothetical protein